MDRDARLGGKLRTDAEGAFLLEAGPDSFLTRKPAGLRLIFHPGAVADALDAALNDHLDDGAAHGRFNPRKSALRALVAASRVTRAVSSAEASPFNCFGAVPSRSALSVS